jgi:MerR family transcriptional regulator, redox-sensitive transcriptional activator SoxR
MRVKVNFKSSEVPMLRSRDLLTVGQASDRSGFAPSALRYYERMGLVAATRTRGGQRRYERNVLRRLAFIRAARNVGLSLEEVQEALLTLPSGRAPNRGDWARLSRGWRGRLDEQIRALTALRDGLDSCIGCGCLSLRTCSIQNPADVAASQGLGAAYLPSPLTRPLNQRHPTSASGRRTTAQTIPARLGQ